MYPGTWLLRNGNFSTKFPVFQKTSGNIIFELTSSVTDISGVHYVQVILWNLFSLDFFLLLDLDCLLRSQRLFAVYSSFSICYQPKVMFILSPLLDAYLNGCSTGWSCAKGWYVHKWCRFANENGRCICVALPPTSNGLEQVMLMFMFYCRYE